MAQVLGSSHILCRTCDGDDDAGDAVVYLLQDDGLAGKIPCGAHHAEQQGSVTFP